MSFDTHRIYDSVIISSGWTSQIVSATTISAGTFYGGSLSASFVGNQNVTDQEFKYLSGTTANTQIQLNNIVNKTEKLITHQSDLFLNSGRTMTSGNNLNFINYGNLLSINASYPSLELGYNEVSINQSESAITNWNPINFNTNNKSTVINVTSMLTPSIISGLQGGSEGRIAIIHNDSTQLIILENKSSKTQIGNRFVFSNNIARFLVRGSNITLIYRNNVGWVNLFPFNSNHNNYIFDDFTGIRKPATQVGSLPAATIYEQFRPFPTQMTDQFYGPKQIFGYGPSINTNGVVVVSSSTPTLGTVNSSAIGLNRANGKSPYTVTVSKIKLNDYYNNEKLTSEGSAVYFSNIANWPTNTASATLFTNANTNAQFWVTPITSATLTNTSNWYTRVGLGSYQVSSVPLSATTNNWVYFGIYRVGDNGGSFFYSYDGYDYNWERIIDTSSSAGNNGGFFSLASRCSIPNIIPAILSDWILINKGY